MMQYAVIGQPIEHSLSPFIHQYFAKQFGLVFEYGKILVDPAFFEQQVKAFFQAGGKGLNVTAPYKQQAFAMADVATSRCVKARAANTLWQQSGQLMADTTDGVGLMRDLSRYLGSVGNSSSRSRRPAVCPREPERQRATKADCFDRERTEQVAERWKLNWQQTLDVSGKNILILGAGGAVRSILDPLMNAAPASITLANRTISRAVELQSEFNREGLIKTVELEKLHQPYEIIINAIPGRMDQAVFLPKIIFQQALLAYDLSYHLQGNTPFVMYAHSLNCRAVDGFGMLVCQAAESFNLWHARMPDVSKLLHSRHATT